MDSPTKIDTARDCLRKAYYRYFTDLPKPPSGPGAELGSAVHDVAEGYLAHGKAPDRDTPAGKIFIPGLPHLPPPGSGGVEGWIRFTVSERITYNGRVDLVTRAGVLPGFDGDPYLPIILDHKTSKDPNAHGKGPEQLATDSQVLIYGMWLAAREAKTGLTRAGFRWVYYATLGRPRAYPVDLVLSYDQLTAGFGQYIWPVSLTLAELEHERPRAEDVPCSPEACGKYGGCPYMGVCPITPAQRLSGAFNTEDRNMGESLLQKLQKRQVAGVNPPAQAPAAPPPVQAPAARTRSRKAAGEGEIATAVKIFAKAVITAACVIANPGETPDDVLGVATYIYDKIAE